MKGLMKLNLFNMNINMIKDLLLYRILFYVFGLVILRRFNILIIINICVFKLYLCVNYN